MTWVLPILLLILFEVIADVFSKQWSLSGSYVMWTMAILGYIVANIFWLMAIRDGAGLAKGALLFSVSSAILATLLGLVLYKEVLTITQLVGVGMGIVSLILILI